MMQPLGNHFVGGMTIATDLGNGPQQPQQQPSQQGQGALQQPKSPAGGGPYSPFTGGPA
jgi:hypothetical protein